MKYSAAIIVRPAILWSWRSGAGGDAPDRLSARLRALSRPVIGHIHDGALLLDLRCLEDDDTLLTALAVTSNNLSIRRMGAQGWRNLHKLVYVAAPLVALHWIWSLKTFPVTPTFWLLVILLLLGLRVVIKRPLARARPARA